MADLFKEILPSIMLTKKKFMLTEQDEKSYPAFMVNRALSHYRDTVLLANQMNLTPNLDNKLQADFYLNIIRPFRRPFVKWYKKVENDSLDMIKKYYGYSNQKAIDVLSILSDAQVNEIKEQLYKGV